MLMLNCARCPVCILNLIKNSNIPSAMHCIFFSFPKSIEREPFFTPEKENIFHNTCFSRLEWHCSIMCCCCCCCRISLYSCRVYTAHIALDLFELLNQEYFVLWTQANSLENYFQSKQCCWSQNSFLNLN